MSLTFYPHSEDAQRGSLEERAEVLIEAAERYKAFILDAVNKGDAADEGRKFPAPRDQIAAYNWEEIARLLREVRELPEMSKGDKVKKAKLLTKLADIYDVLRAAKMPKLEAVRLALIGEANQLNAAA